MSNMGNKDALRSKGTNSVVDQLSGANSSHIIYGDEFDTTVMMLNMAVMWFHDHEYARAYSILDSLYQKIEPIDKATAILICLLFLHVTLASHDIWRFVAPVSDGRCIHERFAQGDSKLEYVEATFEKESARSEHGGERVKHGEVRFCDRVRGVTNGAHLSQIPPHML
ncbi:hypothetical protein U1Q18_002824 [Sarracenia purpurea var. burkii]